MTKMMELCNTTLAELRNICDESQVRGREAKPVTEEFSKLL